MKTLLCTSLIAVLTAAPAVAADVPDDIYFEVLRNGSRFGEHVVRFSEGEEGQVLVDIGIELSVRFGPLTVFRYEHEASEIWRDGRLIEMQAETLKDGERNRVRIARESADALRAMSGLIPDLIPSSHWLGYEQGTAQILNTETGEPMDVVITDLGVETIETPSGQRDARRIRMEGSVTVDLWYDAEGRWVGCAFDVRGQSIVYRLVDA